MTEGAARERHFASVAADESRRPGAGEGLADQGRRDAGRRRRRFEPSRSSGATAARIS